VFARPFFSARPFFCPTFFLPDLFSACGEKPMDEATALEIAACDRVYQGFFRIDKYRLRHRLFDGGWTPMITREVIERGNAAAVLLYDPDLDAVVFVEQFRLPAHLAGFPGWQIEIIAGMVEAGAAPEAVALSEIGEEAGLTIIGDLIPIHRFLTSPGGTTETVDLFCARVDSRQAAGIHGLSDEHEDIRVRVVSYDEAMRLVRDGTIVNGFALLALYWLGANRETICRCWPESRCSPPVSAAGCHALP
jgi:ADP-ribose pyrophosphatase